MGMESKSALFNLWGRQQFRLILTEVFSVLTSPSPAKLGRVEIRAYSDFLEEGQSRFRHWRTF